MDTIAQRVGRGGARSQEPGLEKVKSTYRILAHKLYGHFFIFFPQRKRCLFEAAKKQQNSTANIVRKKDTDV